MVNVSATVWKTTLVVASVTRDGEAAMVLGVQAIEMIVDTTIWDPSTGRMLILTTITRHCVQLLARHCVARMEPATMLRGYAVAIRDMVRLMHIGSWF